ncbi:MAG: hypothetical protein IJN31_06170, partial [Peptococcaceae bacterium]|nr:hypothetical protein [Peptococcaceae bacterium]
MVILHTLFQKQNNKMQGLRCKAPAFCYNCFCQTLFASQEESASLHIFDPADAVPPAALNITFAIRFSM